MADAVLLHPHFALGGDQHNHVITAVYERLLGTAVTPHRFDFTSAEVAISQAEAEAQIEACGGLVILVGYSFGGEVAAAITHPAVIGWALVAPALVEAQFVTPASPFHLPATAAIAPDPRPKLVVMAEFDAWFGPDVIDPLISVWQYYEQQTVPNADHFFAATADDVAERVTTWVEQVARAAVETRSIGQRTGR